MSLADLPHLDDEALDALLTAADPLAGAEPATADTPEAAAMLAAILDDDVQPLPLRRRRGPVLFAAVALAAGAAAAGVQWLVPDTDEPFDLVCHASVLADGTLASVPTDGIATVADAAARCRQVLGSGELGPDALRAATGPMAVCEDDAGGLGVFPATSCAQVELADVRPVDPDVGGAPADVAQVRAALAELQAADGCTTPDQLLAQYVQVAAGTPASDWPLVEVGDVGPGTCASLTLDAGREVVVMVGRPAEEPPGADGDVDLDAVDAGLDALYDGYWDPSECVTQDEVAARVAELVEGTVLAGFDVVVRPSPPSADTCVELFDVVVADAEVVFAPVPSAP